MKVLKSALIILTLALAGSLFSGCFLSSITGSGNLTTKEFGVSGFSGLHVQNGFDIEVSQSPGFSIEVTADDNVMEHVQVFKEGDSLVVRLKPTRTYGSVTLKAVITMPELKNLELSGGSEATLSGFSSSQSFSANLSGGSIMDGEIGAGNAEFNLSGGSRAEGAIDVADVDFNLSGGSRVEFTGTGGDLSINASGGSNLDLAGFLVQDADVNLSGGSQADINPGGSIESNISGSSRLYVRGQAYTP